jgi:ubiquinone/menaquinone biosynthesis C-methylase UbiE
MLCRGPLRASQTEWVRVMSWLFAAAYDPFMRKSERACLRDWREELLAPLSGRVIEIGAGTGANVAHYPKLERLVLTEPDRHMLERLDAERRRALATAEVVQASADALPFADASFDVAVATLVLCSVPDLGRALAEVRRVLRPGGALVFLEHVAAEDVPSRLVWQERLEPFWCRIAGNCHLARRTAAAITNAGFELESVTKDSMRKALPVVRATIRGVARLPAPAPVR